ncbi:MAG: hypothetical protein HJJLKODD_00742 [Phycisphaerae bacterium]|nr:hypothetical protein [Phycisphaerae bacterium]
MKISIHPEGLLLAVKVVPGSSRDRISGWLGESLKVQLTTAPEKGKANAALLALLAQELGLTPSTMQIWRGVTQPRKSILIRGISAEQLLKRLARIIPEP